MKNTYNSNYEDIIVAIGPSICKNCFEVGKEVYDSFKEKFSWCDRYSEYRNGKYYMDLQRIIRHVLVETGVPEKNILISDICTKCNTDLFSPIGG